MMKTIYFTLLLILVNIYYICLYNKIEKQTELITKIIPIQTEELKRQIILNHRLKKAYDYLIESGQIKEY